MRDEASRPVRRHKWLRRQYVTLRALVTTSHRGFSIFDWRQRSDRATTPLPVRNVDKTPKDSRPLRDPFCRLVLTCGHDERNCEQLNCSLLALSEQIYTDAIGF